MLKKSQGPNAAICAESALLLLAAAARRLSAYVVSDGEALFTQWRVERRRFATSWQCASSFRQLAARHPSLCLHLPVLRPLGEVAESCDPYRRLIDASAGNRRYRFQERLAWMSSESCYMRPRLLTVMTLKKRRYISGPPLPCGAFTPRRSGNPGRSHSHLPVN